MMKEINQNLTEDFGQEMYFNERIAKEMIEREKNISHDVVSKSFEAILLIEFENRNKLRIADLGAGAYPIDYFNFIEFLKRSEGKIYWVDQSPFMLNHAQRSIPREFQNIFEFKKEEMMGFLERKRRELDGIIFKYSFNYITQYSLEKKLKMVYESLEKGGKVFANIHFYEEEGMEERSYNAVYKIKGKKNIIGYKPKDNEIIEIEFLKRGGDKKTNPEIFAKTKIVYYSRKYIMETAQKIGFSEIKIFNDWRENKRWENFFKHLNPGMKAKSNTFLYLCR